jgi:hypothetical protein
LNLQKSFDLTNMSSLQNNAEHKQVFRPDSKALLEESVTKETDLEANSAESNPRRKCKS